MTVDLRPFDVIVHSVDGVGLVEFEPADFTSDGQDDLPVLHAALARLALADDITDLRHLAAREMRRITGFDQVMVYHFHADDHGEVVADDHRAGMASYLGLHFPASDIPAQARRLYLVKGSGLIADAGYEPSPRSSPSTTREPVPRSTSAGLSCAASPPTTCSSCTTWARRPA